MKKEQDIYKKSWSRLETVFSMPWRADDHDFAYLNFTGSWKAKDRVVMADALCLRIATYRERKGVNCDQGLSLDGRLLSCGT